MHLQQPVGIVVWHQGAQSIWAQQEMGWLNEQSSHCKGGCVAAPAPGKRTQPASICMALLVACCTRQASRLHAEGSPDSMPALHSSRRASAFWLQPCWTA